MPSINEITQALAGTAFPAAKEELYDIALDNEATEDILAVLDKLPNREFESMSDITEHLSENEDSLDPLGEDLDNGLDDEYE